MLAILDSIYEQNENMAMLVGEEKLAVGGDIKSSSSRTSNIDKPLVEMASLDTQANLSVTHATNIESSAEVASSQLTPAKQSAKARFYANVDHQRQARYRSENQERYRDEVGNLRREVAMRAESVAHDLLGNPNRKLSNGSTLKYGNNGSLAVRVSGAKAGTWYDFESGKGGDLFDLVQKEKHCDFKESVSYLQNKLGMTRHNLSAVEYHEVANKYVDYRKQQAKDKAEEMAKIRKAEDLYARSRIIDHNSTAAHYLVGIRKIDIDFEGKGEKSDIRVAEIYEKSINKQLPALVAFARDASGKITGGQQILLDSMTGNKAMVETAKRSFGRISGSFIDVSRLADDIGGKGNITIIAEGLETALSVEKSLSHDLISEDQQVRVLCSLGINNIKNYQPVFGEKIIIAADNDGEVAITNITIDTAKNELTNKGAVVEIVRPSKIGDFNDILREYTVT